MCETIDFERIVIRNTDDIVRARGVARQTAARIGFSLADQTRVATGVSELARNVVQYADEGFCDVADVSNKDEMRLRILVEDHGPGMHDIDMAMRDGYSTGGGLGAGLPGTRRLMNEFAIESQPGLTRIVIVLIRKKP